jgi:hypothetical protein
MSQLPRLFRIFIPLTERHPLTFVDCAMDSPARKISPQSVAEMMRKQPSEAERCLILPNQIGGMRRSTR